MSFIHGKNTFVSIDGDNLSAYGTNCEFNRTADPHDVTTFGKNSHVYQGGLGDGSTTLTGVYDNTAGTGPRAVLDPLVGQVVPLIYRPEGTGTGRPEKTVDVLVGTYGETSPVADMVTWTVELQHSDDVVLGTQA